MRRQAQQKELLKALAGHIRTRRRALGLTQEEFAERVGVSTNYLARLELGNNTPSIPTLVRLARAMDMRVSDILSVEREHAEPCPAEEIALALESLDEDDAEFVLGQLRSLVAYARSKSGG